MGEQNEARGLLGPILGAALFVGLLGATATALSQAAAHGAGVFGTVSLARPSVVVLAMASAFFLASGVLRLARWRIVGEPHSAFAGAALLVVGGVCLPLGALALLFPVTQHGSLVGPVIRTIAVLVAIALVVRALTAMDVTPAELPARLLPRLFAGLTLVFLLLLAAQHLAPHTMTGRALPAMVLAGVRALSWFGVALYAATRATELLWARRVAPLLMGMGFAEALRGLRPRPLGCVDLRRPPGLPVDGGPVHPRRSHGSRGRRERRRAGPQRPLSGTHSREPGSCRAHRVARAADP